MPWRKTCPVEERKRFIEEFFRHQVTMTDLCWNFGISRKTGYKWLDRFKAHGYEGLKDLPRSPHSHPLSVPEQVVSLILEVRVQHPRWGPKKLRAALDQKRPDISWPAPSTIGEILKRHGLVVSRKRRRRVAPYTEPFVDCLKPNDVWCADFKGWFRTGDGQRCDPLTISDAHSRYLFRCQGLIKADGEHVRPLFEATFREYGLPLAIRTDNGPPFASRGVGGLSRLSVWWIKLGIRPERIEPGKPQQNGRHERMHRTLKEETASPPRCNLRLQQRAFDLFLEEYNFDRPHEALDMRCPGDLYCTSPREYPRRIPEMEYPDYYLVRSVRQNGCIKWRGELFLSETLVGEKVGLRWVNEQELEIYFGPVMLAVLNDKKRRISRPRPGGLAPQVEVEYE